MQKRKREKQPRVSAVVPAVQRLSTTVRAQGQECVARTGGPQGVLNGGFHLTRKKKNDKDSVHTPCAVTQTGPVLSDTVCCSDQDLVTHSDICRLTCM